MTQHPLPAWPEMPAPSVLYSAAYERAMKEAYAARLRVAVDLLKVVAADDDHYTNAYHFDANKALEAIGPLPTLPTLPPPPEQQEKPNE